MKINIFDPYVSDEEIKSFGGNKIENLDKDLKIVIIYHYTHL